MDDKSIIDLKAFVPAKDSAISRQFYVDLGFTQNWANDEIAEFQIGAFRFLLQTFYVKEHAGNFMMNLAVEDADLWWKHIKEINLTEKYPGIMAKPPTMQPWGLRVLY
ncbi:MAG: glyoxalase, partial [Blastocatellia bacterium]